MVHDFIVRCSDISTISEWIDENQVDAYASFYDRGYETATDRNGMTVIIPIDLYSLWTKDDNTAIHIKMYWGDSIKSYHIHNYAA